MTTRQHGRYKTLFPKHLHLQVEALLDYLTYYPYQSPSQCPHCHSKRFHKLGKMPRLYGETLNTQYHCNNCNRHFSQLTNTIFSGSLYLDIWRDLAILYFAGAPRKTIYTQLNISANTYYRYLKKINSHMQTDYPALYTWWCTHQKREDLTFTKKIAKQADTFYQWFDTLINSREYHCPKCHKKMHKKDYKTPWPRFICYPCNHHFNALDGTQLRGLLYIELWPKVAKCFIEGSTDTDIYNLYKIQTKTVSIWRKRFIEQMKALNLPDLVQWVEWQTRRRLIQTQNHDIHTKKL